MQISNTPKNKKSKDFTFEERICQDVFLLLANDEFLADIEAIQKKYDFPTANDNKDWDEIPFVLSDENFKKDSEALRKKYNLPLSHEFALNTVIQGYELADCNFDYNFWHLNPNIKVATENKKDCITLDIYPDTTLKDIQRNWPRIKIARDHLLKRPIKRKNKSENLQRDMEILRLKKERKTIKEITTAINNDKRFSKEIVAYEEIPKIIKRLKDKVKKLIPSKET